MQRLANYASFESSILLADIFHHCYIEFNFLENVTLSSTFSSRNILDYLYVHSNTIFS